VQTSAPTRVSTTIHTPAPVQTSAPTRVQTSAPTVVRTSAPRPVKTSAPAPVQTSAPTRVQTSAPARVSTTIHTPAPVQTSAPAPVQTSAPTVVRTSASAHVSTTIHPTVAKTPSLAPSPTQSIIISPHIKIIIQNIKYYRKSSYQHVDNLFQKLKTYNEDYSIYRQLLLTRYRVEKHYDAILHSIQQLLRSENKHDDNQYIKNPPHFIQSMQKLNQAIEHIEHSIKFIKGNHKYILLTILNDLKLQYKTDTQRILDKWNSQFS